MLFSHEFVCLPKWNDPLKLQSFFRIQARLLIWANDILQSRHSVFQFMLNGDMISWYYTPRCFTLLTLHKGHLFCKRIMLVLQHANFKFLVALMGRVVVAQRIFLFSYLIFYCSLIFLQIWTTGSLHLLIVFSLKPALGDIYTVKGLVEGVYITRRRRSDFSSCLGYRKY